MTERRDQHVDAATVAELDAGVLDRRHAEEVSAHLDSCPDCSRARGDLAQLSDLLAAAPSPPLPSDVAARLDAALERATRERRASAGDDTGTVVQLTPRRRRWLAPLAAAASVIAGVAVVGQVVQSPSGDGDAGSVAGDAAEGAAGSDDVGGSRRPEPLLLSTTSFRRDVARALAGDTAAMEHYNDTGHAPSQAEQRKLGCAPPKWLADRAEARRALLDGEPALLFLSGPPSDRLAVAVTCDKGGSRVVVRARLDLR